MKRLFLYLLVLSLVLALAGCAEKSPAAEETLDTANSSTPNRVTTDETASTHIPEPGEDLATALDNEHLKNLDQDPPVAINIHIDHGGPAETAELTDSEAIAEFLRYFSEVRIDSETNEMVTDNYNGFSFTFSDGETVSFSLNLKNLEFSAHAEYHLYTLSGFDNLWSYMNDVAEFPEE